MNSEKYHDKLISLKCEFYKDIEKFMKHVLTGVSEYDYKIWKVEKAFENAKKELIYEE